MPSPLIVRLSPLKTDAMVRSPVTSSSVGEPTSVVSML